MLASFYQPCLVLAQLLEAHQLAPSYEDLRAHLLLILRLRDQALVSNEAITWVATDFAIILIFSVPDPATGCGSFTLGISGIPKETETKFPCGQNSSVTNATAGMLSFAMLIPSRTVPVVQDPQWP